MSKECHNTTDNRKTNFFMTSVNIFIFLVFTDFIKEEDNGLTISFILLQYFILNHKILTELIKIMNIVIEIKRALLESI